MKSKKKPEPVTLYPAWDSHLEPAPGDLAFVQALLNTVEVPTKTDRLATPEAVANWLADQGLAGAGTKISRDDQARLRKVRRGLRWMALLNHGKKVKEGVFEDLDRAAAGATLAMRFSGSGAGRIEPAEGGIGGAIARLLHAVIVAGKEGRLKRLKVCREPACRRVYYDFSANRSSKWCSERCGNRRSAKRYRRRNKNVSLGWAWWDDGEI